MSSADKNLSKFEGSAIPDGTGMKIGILVSEWNIEITDALRKGAVQTLLENNVASVNIIEKYVPGSYELTLGAQMMCMDSSYDAVICLGCVIQGETRHFDFICNAVANGITNVNLQFNKPVIFGVLTTDTLLQAQERAGGKHGNKGTEAAVTALKMIALKRSL